MQVHQVNTTLNLNDITVNPEYEAIVPPLTEEEFERLKNSIAEVGLYEPIVVNKERVILDGHHRFKACKETDVLPRFTVKSFGSKIEEEIYVIETNVIRRQLNQYQATILGLKLEPKYEVRARKRMLAGTPSPTWDKGRTDEKAADAVGLSRNTYNRSKYVLNKGTPTQLDLFKKGKKRAGALYREIKHQEKIEEIKRKIPELVEPQGEYDVIVIDPPWPYKTPYDADNYRGSSPYPEMEIEEIKKMELPTSENCIIWLWTTNRFIHDAFHILEEWGYTPKSILTWAKDKMGLGVWLRGQTEHCILAVKGKPIWDLKGQTTLLKAPTRGHSTKPDEFYDLVDTLCFGSKLDFFARDQRDGWASHGTMEGSARAQQEEK